MKQREEKEMTFKPRLCEKSWKLTDVRHRSPVPHDMNLIERSWNVLKGFDRSFEFNRT